MPKYQVTGWSPTAMYAMVEIEARNAKEAAEEGHEALLEAGDFEYVDDHPVTTNGLDCVRAESDEATDTYQWSELDEPKAAARAMLAALKEMQAALTAYGLRDVKKRFSLCVADSAASKAITRAEAAGIRSED